MGNFERKDRLPIGVQDFENLRRNGYRYIDKTAELFNVVHDAKANFLSRPRRFGKSLLLSTLRAYWEGKKELFEGLAIEALEAEIGGTWEAHPVFYFDFNGENFLQEGGLENILDRHLMEWESVYGKTAQSDASLAGRFRYLLHRAVEQTGKNAVVLVDEYDKPLLETMADKPLEEHNRAVFKGFFSTLKSEDHYLEFAFLTGVTKFSKVSIFSDLNHLNDISLLEEYGTICGITEEEIRLHLLDKVQQMAEKRRLTEEECFSELKKMYDGYHFHQDSVGVYNPYSLLRALNGREFGSYWFESGTPTFLVNKIRDTDFDVRAFSNGKLYSNPRSLSDYRIDNPDILPLLYQTGYLTIIGYDSVFQSLQLGYPNNEVKYAFIECLAASFFTDENTARNPLDIREFGMDLFHGDTDSIRDRLTALYARLPYTTDERPLEQNFQNVAYIVFTLLGQYVHTEYHSAKGRADIIVETPDYVYIFEFKRDASAREALAQIEERGYAKLYAADSRTLYCIGASFDSAERTLAEWEVR